ATSVTAPPNSLALMCLCTAGRMRWSRSLENPTSSGFESVNVAPGAGTTRTTHSIAAAIDFKLEGIASLLYGPDWQLFYSDSPQPQRTVSRFRIASTILRSLKEPHGRLTGE